MGQKRGRQAGPCLTLWAGPRPPLARYDLLDCVDFARPGFSVHRVGRAPSFQPPCLGMAARGTEVGSDRPPMGEQARLGDGKVIQYLFIYSPWIGLEVSQPHLSALSPECSGDPSSAPASLVPPCGEPHPETCCWTQGSSGYPGADPPPVNVSPLFCPQPCFGRVGKWTGKWSQGVSARPSPPLTPSQGRALLAQGWSDWAPGLLGPLPARKAPAHERERNTYLIRLYKIIIIITGKTQFGSLFFFY